MSDEIRTVSVPDGQGTSVPLQEPLPSHWSAPVRGSLSSQLDPPDLYGLEHVPDGRWHDPATWHCDCAEHVTPAHGSVVSQTQLVQSPLIQ